MATYLGVIDENQINEMSYVFFESILTELGHKLTYDAVVNYAGNSFAKDSWDLISRHNPLSLEPDGGVMSDFAKFLNSVDIRVVRPGGKEENGKEEN